MNREPRRIPPKLLAPAAKRRVTRDLANLPKKEKDIVKRGSQGMIPLSPSQPHSKSFGR
jgi:hypothetical protein